MTRGEAKVAKLLDSLGVKYEREKNFGDCRDTYPLRFDFYLPDYDMCIEYDGPQHFYVTQIGNMSMEEAKEKYLYVKKHDVIKYEYCKSYKIKLVRVNEIWKGTSRHIDIEEQIKVALNYEKSIGKSVKADIKLIKARISQLWGWYKLNQSKQFLEEIEEIEMELIKLQEENYETTSLLGEGNNSDQWSEIYC